MSNRYRYRWSWYRWYRIPSTCTRYRLALVRCRSNEEHNAPCMSHVVISCFKNCNQWWSRQEFLSFTWYCWSINVCLDSAHYSGTRITVRRLQKFYCYCMLLTHITLRDEQTMSLLLCPSFNYNLACSACRAFPAREVWGREMPLFTTDIFRNSRNRAWKVHKCHDILANGWRI